MEKKSEEKLMYEFNGLRIKLASPEEILKWSHGEVTKPETINYRTFRPEKDGLFDERIFGPTKDYECYCGKYKRIRYKGIVCDRCGVEVTISAVRRERMGHIKLATPIAHIWYSKGTSSILSIILDIPAQAIEKIIYFALYLVKKINDEKRNEVIEKLEELKKLELDNLENDHRKTMEEVEKNYKKERENIIKQLTNKEQQDIALEELEIKIKERKKILSDELITKKSQIGSFFDFLIKKIRSLYPLDTLEEDHYLFLREKDLHHFVEVGMGAEVLYEVLSSIDIKKLYQKSIEELYKAKGEKRNKLLKKIKTLESLIKAEINPVWTMITVLPVLPPDLRPVVQLPGGKFATSDLNDFYRRVINRNNRLKQLINLGAPEIILRNEKRMLQEAVDSLIDLPKAHGRTRTQGAASKVKKSLSDILRGKQGRFRQNLLGKRVDYSGRSTIIVGPDLRLDQCGIPKEMAIELFKPFILREIIVRGYATNLKSAKTFLETKDPVIYDILEEITKNHPVLLNRAPTLHKLSILGFYPVLTDDYAIKLHPAVCSGYNADFDGDAMGVFLPISKNAIEEVKTTMLPYFNLLKPADGTPIVVPNKEMAMGAYYLTTIDSNLVKDKKELKFFVNEDEAISAYHLKKIDLREPILVKIDGKTIETTVGRIIFNQRLPLELRYLNEEVKAADLKVIIMEAMKKLEEKKVGELIDNLKEIGFWGATISGGFSFSIFDIEMVEDKEELIRETEEKIREIEESYRQGLLTIEEKKKFSNNYWIEITEKLADATWQKLNEENPVKLAIKSGGPRASREQLKQLAAIKGLVVDPLGKIIDIPTKSNYREGLSVFEYMISARGARKGLTDSALKTADAGYLTRRLVDVAHDVIIREEDCGTDEGLLVKMEEERGDKIFDRIKGRLLLEDIIDGKTNKIILKKGEIITKEKIELLESKKINAVKVRSPLFCRSYFGVCQKCYGLDLSTGKMVDIGTPVGVMAAQSIGEPGTQLTMRVRHFGGIVIADVTQGLPRVEELFETRTPKIVSPIAEFDGNVNIKEDPEKDLYLVTLTNKDKQREIEYAIPRSQKLRVADGQLVTAGSQLSEGYLDVDDVLAIKGIRAAQIYLLNEIQKVYESQGISIHDKHFEVIIRKMSDKMIIEDEGDTIFVKGEVVSKVRFEEENKKVLSQGGKPAVGKISILGVTRAAIYTDSWLSAASFEQTTNVLSQAAISGKVDYLLGLKENVIIGRLIPVTKELIEKYYGKFLKQYVNPQSNPETRSEKED